MTHLFLWIGKAEILSIVFFLKLFLSFSTYKWGIKIKAKKEFLPLQLGDVPDTYADVQSLIDDVGYKPTTTIDVGISRFIDWYTEHYENIGS